MVERLTLDQQVSGSSPTVGSTLEAEMNSPINPVDLIVGVSFVWILLCLFGWAIEEIIK